MQFELVSKSTQEVPITEEAVKALFAAAEKTIDIPEQWFFSITFVDNPAIAELNQQYRGKMGPTDVLTFPYDDSSDIIISIDKIHSQAEEYGHSVSDESAFLVVHGILHSMGWDHERSDEEDAEQRALETEILQQCQYEYAR